MSTMADPHKTNTAQSGIHPPAHALPGDHPLLELPFAAEIDGRQFQGSAISLTRAQLSGLADPQIAGTSRLLRVVFPFEGFNLTLPIEVRVTDVDPHKGTIELEFIEPSGAHLPQLRHVLNSYIAGDVISLGRVLGVALQPPQIGAGGKKAATGGTSFATRALNTTLMAVATAALVAGAAWIIRDRFFTMAVASPAQVVSLGPQLDAIAAGQIDYIDPNARKGEVAFSIRATTGQTLSVAMPCDCVARSAGPALGATVQSGQPVLQISEPDAPLVLKGRFDTNQLYALSEARSVSARFPDGTVIETRADPASLAAAAAQPAGQTVSVDLLADGTIAAQRQGELARLTIHRKTPLSGLFAPSAADTTVSEE